MGEISDFEAGLSTGEFRLNQPDVRSVTWRRFPSMTSRSLFATIVLSPINVSRGASSSRRTEMPWGISSG
jgi:hypothetical protein